MTTNVDGSISPPAGALQSLQRYTSARVGLVRKGNSIATRQSLDFQMAHAMAKDAVHTEFDVEAFALRMSKALNFGLSVLTVETAAPTRDVYIRKPHLGRSLSSASKSKLQRKLCDVVFLVADGLSVLAPERNAIPLLQSVLPALLKDGWSCGPLVVVKNARVAIADDVGWLMGASMSVILIGERPGLSSADSLSAYITWNPQPARNDAERNCISNIREEGLSSSAAATRLVWYLNQARRRQLTGVALKELAHDLLPG